MASCKSGRRPMSWRKRPAGAANQAASPAEEPKSTSDKTARLADQVEQQPATKWHETSNNWKVFPASSSDIVAGAAQSERKKQANELPGPAYQSADRGPAHGESNFVRPERFGPSQQSAECRSDSNHERPDTWLTNFACPSSGPSKCCSFRAPPPPPPQPPSAEMIPARQRAKRAAPPSTITTAAAVAAAAATKTTTTTTTGNGFVMAPIWLPAFVLLVVGCVSISNATMSSLFYHQHEWDSSGNNNGASSGSHHRAGGPELAKRMPPLSAGRVDDPLSALLQAGSLAQPLAAPAGRAKRQAPSPAAGKGNSSTGDGQQLRLSHHVTCEPISQLNDLRLACPERGQFIVILEAYYADTYPELVCPQVLAGPDGQLARMTSGQLVGLFRHFYGRQSPARATGGLINLGPTLALARSAGRRPFCVDDLRDSFQAKCSGRQECSFARQSDHQFPHCTSLKPGHAFVRHLCIDERLLVRYCNTDTLLASDAQLGPLDFGFVASPGYPNFYATPRARSSRRRRRTSAQKDARQECGWTVQARPGQRVTVKLLDASLAPHKSAASQRPASAPPPDSPEYPDYSVPASAELAGAPALELAGSQPNELLVVSPQEEQPAGGPNSRRAPNVLVLPARPAGSEPGNEPARRITFKIDKHDYELIRAQLGRRVRQVSEQCEHYDQLLLQNIEQRAGAGAGATEPGPSEAGQQEPASAAAAAAAGREFEMISRLPATLYKNNLIDFSNRSVMASDSQPDEQLEPGLPNRGVIDYEQLLAGLNPLELVWLYQQNVSLCSTSQLDQLSAPFEKELISFTSSADTIHLDLISGRAFNPLNRGVLFWYHKHGCPLTRKLPHRARLLFRNETTEILQCLENFVFSDTQRRLRVRRCSLDQQVWEDAEPAAQAHAGQPAPACVFVEDILQNNSIRSEFGRLMLAGDQASQYNLIPSELTPSNPHEEIAVEVVGAPGRPASELIAPDVAMINQNQLADEHARVRALAGQDGGPSGRGLAELWPGLVDLLSPKWELPAGERDDPRRPRIVGSSLLRRLVLPLLAIVALFVLLNLLIYVIFLIILPKFAQLLCARTRAKTHDSGASRDLIGPERRRRAKLAHYESQYSVSLGMSL